MTASTVREVQRGAAEAIERLRAENTRLRTALRQISDECGDGVCAGSAAVNWERAATRAAAHADEALQEGE